MKALILAGLGSEGREERAEEGEPGDRVSRPENEQKVLEWTGGPAW